MKRTNITLRKRLLPSGRSALYLDITHGGRRKTESLKLFLEPELTRADKTKNKETLRLAEAIRAKRVVEVQNNEFDFDTRPESINFYSYYMSIVQEHDRKGERNTARLWRSGMRQLIRYDKDVQRLTFEDITTHWVREFKRYLETAKSINGNRLTHNTQAIYFSKVRACINRAYKEGIITKSPLAGVEGVAKEEGTRMYLTLAEVRTLAATPCKSQNIKNAFLFSCLTGLRRSDVERLTWGEVQEQDNFTRIIFKQKKTGGQEYMDISPRAERYMGKRGKDEETVFKLFLPKDTNYTIQKWCDKAGINKKITFHCARHTFAVMMLDIGTDIYTVSKLLGHKQLATTQIYAKVLDKNKQAAVSRIPDIE